MKLYAHALIELGDRKIPRGAQVDSGEFSPEALEDLRSGGSLSENPYDPEKDKSLPPVQVEIDGVVYVQSNDGMEATDVRP